jgi:hypothetical protein
MTSNMGSQIIQDKFENIKGTIEDVTESAKAGCQLIKPYDLNSSIVSTR